MTVTPAPKTVRPERVVNSWTRVSRSPHLILGMWALQALIAWTAGGFVRRAVSAAMEGHAFLDRGRRLLAISELSLHEPVVSTTALGLLVTAAALAAAAWLLASGGLITSLARFDTPSNKRRFEHFASACGRWLPALAVQTLYGLVLRAILVAGLLAAVWKLHSPFATAAALVVGWGLAVLVLDRARSAVVLEGARRFSPMTVLKAVPFVLVRPTITGPGLALVTLQWGACYGILALAIADPLNGATIWVVRVASVVMVALGLFRLSLAVHHARV